DHAVVPRPARPRPHRGAHRPRGGQAGRAHPPVGRDVHAGGRRPGGRRGVLLPAARPVAHLPRARRGPEGLGRRRQRALGLPQRLRLDDPGPRAPRDRPGDLRALRPGHALRGAHGGLRGRRRGARAPLPPAQVALHELGLGGDHGRHPDRPGGHGARRRPEDLRLLPRPPRHGHGLDRRGVRPHRPPRAPRVDPVRRGRAAEHGGPGPRDPLQRRRRHGPPDHRAGPRGPQARLRDHGGGDDEPRGRAPRAGLPAGRARDLHAPRRRPDLRRGQDRALHRGGRRRGALRRRARHAHARQGPGRRAAHGRHRDERGDRRGRRGRLRLPGGDLQREPARDGGRPGEPARGPDARGLRAPGPPQRPHPRGLLGRGRALRPAGLRHRHLLEGLRDLRAREGHGLRDLQDPPGRGALRPRVAVEPQPRDLHDAGPRGGVDAVGDPHRRGDRPLRL
ncbi:MAG: Aminotransferase, class III, partial [uncultured Solirubrobacteraceae bacterium]